MKWKCEKCGKELSAKNNVKRYCGDRYTPGTCANKRKNEIMARYNKRMQEQRKAEIREYAKKRQYIARHTFGKSVEEWKRDIETEAYKRGYADALKR